MLKAFLFALNFCRSLSLDIQFFEDQSRCRIISLARLSLTSSINPPPPFTWGGGVTPLSEDSEWKITLIRGRANDRVAPHQFDTYGGGWGWGGLLMPPSLRSPHKGGAGGLVACQLQRRRCECDGPAKWGVLFIRMGALRLFMYFSHIVGVEGALPPPLPKTFISAQTQNFNVKTT